MLNLNATQTDNALETSLASTSSNSNENGGMLWKALIFDKFGQDIISSIMRVNDLRENGVTVHM